MLGQFFRSLNSHCSPQLTHDSAIKGSCHRRPRWGLLVPTCSLVSLLFVVRRGFVLSQGFCNAQVPCEFDLLTVDVDRTSRLQSIGLKRPHKDGELAVKLYTIQTMGPYYDS